MSVSPTRDLCYRSAVIASRAEGLRGALAKSLYSSGLAEFGHKYEGKWLEKTRQSAAKHLPAAVF
jgi:hypothetical protein